jgi:hypothetical protein
MHISVFQAVGGFDEKERDPKTKSFHPDDLVFFNKHLDNGGRIFKVGGCQIRLRSSLKSAGVTEEQVRQSAASHFPGETITEKAQAPLLVYRYHPNSVTHSTPRKVLLAVRVPFFERRVLSLPRWSQFTIWGAGRDGKDFLNKLSLESLHKIRAFCDIDEKKIGRKYFIDKIRKHIPIIHFSDAQPPLIICVAKKFRYSVERVGRWAAPFLKSLYNCYVSMCFQGGWPDNEY